MGLYWKNLSEGDRKSMKAIVVNGSMYSSRRVENVSRMKSRIAGSGLFIQDDLKETISKSLSAGKSSTKDDMVLLDKNLRVLEYFTSSQSPFAPGYPVYNILEMIRKGLYKKTCGTPPKPAVPTIGQMDMRPELGPGCDTRENTRARGGKRKKVGRTATPCECHNKCKGYVSYMFRVPKPNKNPKSKRIPKAPCWCFPGQSKGKNKGKAIFSSKPNKMFISGAVML